MGAIKVQDKDYNLEEKDEALIKAIQELTMAIKILSRNKW